MLKYGTKLEDTDILNNTYPDLPYLTYDNTFKGLNNFYIPNINLSYTSLNNYYSCRFRFLHIHHHITLAVLSLNFADFERVSNASLAFLSLYKILKFLLVIYFIIFYQRYLIITLILNWNLLIILKIKNLVLKNYFI